MIPIFNIQIRPIIIYTYLIELFFDNNEGVFATTCLVSSLSSIFGGQAGWRDNFIRFISIKSKISTPSTSALRVLICLFRGSLSCQPKEKGSVCVPKG